MKTPAERATEILLWVQEQAYLGKVDVRKTRDRTCAAGEVTDVVMITVVFKDSARSPIVVMIAADERELAAAFEKPKLHVVRGEKP